MCGRDSVVPFIAVVEKHEGLNFEPGSHAERFRTRLNQIAGPATEGVVGATLDELDLWATDAIYPVLLDARAEGAKADDPGNRPVYCTFRYFQKSR